MSFRRPDLPSLTTATTTPVGHTFDITAVRLVERTATRVRSRGFVYFEFGTQLARINDYTVDDGQRDFPLYRPPCQFLNAPSLHARQAGYDAAPR